MTDSLGDEDLDDDEETEPEPEEEPPKIESAGTESLNSTSP